MDLAPLDGGRTRLRLRVRPGAKKDAILGEHGGALRVSVTAPPERGKANRAVAALLAGALGVPPSSVEITSGESSPDKVVALPLPPEEVRRRLGASSGTKPKVDRGQEDLT
jgi:uncharacterized protein (TIGR00251 family)